MSTSSPSPEPPAPELVRKRLITIQELSEEWSVPVATLYNWVYRRRVPHVKLGRLLRFDPDALEYHLSRSTIGSAGKR